MLITSSESRTRWWMGKNCHARHSTRPSVSKCTHRFTFKLIALFWWSELRAEFWIPTSTYFSFLISPSPPASRRTIECLNRCHCSLTPQTQLHTLHQPTKCLNRRRLRSRRIFFIDRLEPITMTSPPTVTITTKIAETRNRNSPLVSNIRRSSGNSNSKPQLLSATGRMKFITTIMSLMIMTTKSVSHRMNTAMHTTTMTMMWCRLHLHNLKYRRRRAKWWPPSRQQPNQPKRNHGKSNTF